MVSAQHLSGGHPVERLSIILIGNLEQPIRGRSHYQIHQERGFFSGFQDRQLPFASFEVCPH